jgi:hypothetical protein
MLVARLEQVSETGWRQPTVPLHYLLAEATLALFDEAPPPMRKRRVRERIGEKILPSPDYPFLKHVWAGYGRPTSSVNCLLFRSPGCGCGLCASSSSLQPWTRGIAVGPQTRPSVH